METTTLETKTTEKQAAPQLNPEHILQIGMGFWASKTLLAAIKFKLFTLLAKGKLTAEEIKTNIGLHPRSLYDFLDTLVALGFLQRDGFGELAKYGNAAETDFFLDKNKPTYLGGMLEMGNSRLYKFWGDLEEGLTTGKPQNEIKYSGKDSSTLFDGVYSNPEALREFLRAMAGIQMGAFMSFAGQFDFSKYKTLTDAGGALGALSTQVALNQPHMRCISFDLPAVKPIAEEFISKHNVADRVSAVAGDFFKDGLPKSDVVVMGNILHDWDKKEKLHLMKLAYDALPAGGAFVCIESIIDNERNKNAFGLMMSLNMLIETNGGYDFTFNDFDELAHEAGFTKTDWLPLAGPTSAAIAYK